MRSTNCITDYEKLFLRILLLHLIIRKMREKLSSTANVTGSSTAFEIYNEPLIRGTTGRVRLKVNNLGSARTEFLTSQNGGPTSQVKVNLRDQDGNLLATGNLNQRVGSVIVDSGSYASARVEQGNSFLTDPITFTVPASAPYKVIIEAIIDNTYYHYSQDDQVTAPGLKQSVESTIVETAYHAAATSEKTVYKQGETVKITGQAVSNSNSQPMSNVSVKLGISVRGFDRYFTVTTDASGNFSYTFTPGYGEAGTYSLWAVHPDINDRTVQAQFSIVGLQISPTTANIRMAKNQSFDIPVTLKNLGDTSLTNLTFASTASGGMTASIINQGDLALTAGESQYLTLRVTAGSTVGDTGTAGLTCTVDGGQGQTLEAKLDANIALVQAIPIISTNPSLIDTGLVRGSQKIYTFDIKNTGLDALKNARLEGPSTSWMSLTIDKNLGDIGVNQGKTVGILVKPGDSVTQGVYNDRLIIYSDNHIPYIYNIQVTVTSNAIGNIQFDVLNELMQDVSGANITLQNQSLPELIYTLRTGADGTASLFDIPEGRYTFNITAPGHKSFGGSFNISPGMTTTIPIALEVTLVNVEWSVTPVALEDRYEIKVTQTFETNVPTPVLVTEPASITVPELAPGQSFNGEFTVTNYGLIGVKDVNIQFPKSFGEYEIELLATIPKTLNAMQRITIPYRIIRRQAVASLIIPLPLVGEGQGEGCFASSLITRNPSLFDEVKGYGGSPCYNSFPITVSASAVICPGALNERTVTKTTTYTVVTPIPGSNCGGSGGGTSGGGIPAIYTGGGSGSGSQTASGSGLPSGTSSTISLPDSGGGCIYPRRPNGPSCGGGGPSGGDKCKRCEDPTCISPGSALSLGNGTYTFSETDLKVPAHSSPMEWTRTYRSNQIIKSGENWVFAAPMDSPLGWGWHSPWFARAGDGSYLDGEGSYYLFQKDSSGGYMPHYEAGLTFKKIATGYEISEKGGNTRLFNKNGKLAAIKDQRGNTVTLSYDAEEKLISIKDVTGREVYTFNYDGTKHITSVTDIAGRQTIYEYDPTTYGRGNLIKVSLALPNEETKVLNTYEYDSKPYPTAPAVCYYGTDTGLVCENGTCSNQTITGWICPKFLGENNYHNLVKKTNAAGESYTIIYSPQWRDKGIVQSIIDPAGRTMTTQSNFTGGDFTYTDYSGRTIRKTLNKKGDLVSEEEITGSTTKTLKKIEYLDNRTEKTTDEAGNVTYTQKDEWGNIIKKTDGEGNEWRYAYDANLRLISETDPLGTTNRYEYDSYGNKTKEIKAAGTEDEAITTFEYNQYNELTSVTKDGAITTYSYDDAGKLTEIKDPMGNITTMTYDAVGNMLTRTQPLAGDTTFENYDHKGNPGKITDPNGNIITYTYDILGRVKTTTNQADNSTTQYFYVTAASCSSCSANSGGSGKIDYIILPEGNKIDYDYDNAGNLIKITDNEGNSINYTYDGRGNKLKEEIKDANGGLQKAVNYAYDQLNRQTKTINPDNTYTETGYDPRGNRASVKNPNGNITTYTYDAANRLTKVTQPNNSVTAYTYDRRANLTSVTDANGNTTTYEYDRQNRLTKTISPDTGTATYTYDLNGNLKTKTDAKGITVTYSYDALNRVTKTDFPEDIDITYTYDTCLNGKGRLCAMTDASGATSNEYSPKGQTAKETRLIDGVTYTTEYSYDRNGNIKTMKYPSGRVIAYNYTDNKITGILNDGIAIAANIAYKPFGGMSAISYGNGVAGTIGYDNQYRISNITAGTVQNFAYTYDNNGNITGINNNIDPTKNKSYTYDVLDRLATATGPWGSLSWTYDGVGNRQTQTDNAGTNSYAYTANKLTEVTGQETKSFAYDINGNTASENMREFVYNQNQRLIKVADSGIVLGEYVYSGNGQRVKKSVNGQTTVFHYSLSGQIIAESDSSGATTAEYIYNNGAPFAKLEGNNVYYYHNDHLGTPQQMTNGTGEIVWNAEYQPFGEATVTTNTITNNLRFPGQYYDEETGLNYNYYRDYNPVIGRYVEADPIGIEKGKNHLFQYVNANPIKYIDEYGLVGGGGKTCPPDRCEYERQGAYEDCMKKEANATGLGTAQCFGSAITTGVGIGLKSPKAGIIMGVIGAGICIFGPDPFDVPVKFYCKQLADGVYNRCKNGVQ